MKGPGSYGPLEVRMTDDSYRTMQKLVKEYPRCLWQAFGAATVRAHRRFRKVMRSGGGHYGVPKMAPHHAVSTYLRPGQQMGGILAEPTYIVRYPLKSRGGVYIGWPDKLASWAENFQDSACRPFTSKEREYLEKKKVEEIPQTYQRPERDVVNSFADHLRSEWPDMVLERFNVIYRRKLARYGAGNVR